MTDLQNSLIGRNLSVVENYRRIKKITADFVPKSGGVFNGKVSFEKGIGTTDVSFTDKSKINSKEIDLKEARFKVGPGYLQTLTSRGRSMFDVSEDVISFMQEDMSYGYAFAVGKDVVSKVGGNKDGMTMEGSGFRMTSSIDGIEFYDTNQAGTVKVNQHGFRTETSGQHVAIDLTKEGGLQLGNQAIKFKNGKLAVQMDTNKIKHHDIFHEGNVPTKTHVGLDKVENYGTTDDFSNGESNKNASAKAVLSAKEKAYMKSLTGDEDTVIPIYEPGIHVAGDLVIQDGDVVVLV